MRRDVLIACCGILLLAAVIVASTAVQLPHRITVFVNQFHDRHIVVRYYAVLMLAYFLAYALTTTLCLPLTGVMAVIGGWLFGSLGFAVALLSVTIGSIGPFLFSRRFAHRALERIDSRTVVRLRQGFERHRVQYLIMMRLIPWAPFPVTTIAAGAFGVSLPVFVAATAIGFVPAGLALNSIGHGLARLSELKEVSFAQFYSDPAFLVAISGIIAIVALSLLRRVPVVTRFFG